MIRAEDPTGRIVEIPISPGSMSRLPPGVTILGQLTDDYAPVNENNMDVTGEQPSKDEWQDWPATTEAHEVLSQLKHETDELAKLLMAHITGAGTIPVYGRDVREQLAEVHRLALLLDDGELPR